MARELLLELHRRGIRLRLTGGKLDVLAPAGALTEDLRERLAAQRGELVGLLRRSEAGGDRGPALVPRPQELYEPFALTDVQHAYWVGRGSAVELGGVECHYYTELDSTGLDPERLEVSLRRVIARHAMLRAVVGPDGRQRILAEVPEYHLVVADLRGLTPEAQQAETDRIRSEMSHQVRPADQWPLFEFRTARFDGGRLRLYVSIDVLVIDFLSLNLLFRDWRRYYEQPDLVLEPLAVSYRDCVLAELDSRTGQRYRAAEEYWLARIDELPPAPALPIAVRPSQVGRTEFVRRRTRLPRQRWDLLKARAKQYGLTPSAVLATAYGDVLRRWTGQRDFTLNLTLFNRPELHPQINEIVGDFTALTELAITGDPADTFAERARRTTEQLLRDLAYVDFSGVQVLRERSRRIGGGPGAAMPVVFTSALGLSGEDHEDGLSFFGEYVYGISQTPQVWLDHQAVEEGGDLVYNWDAVEALFPEGLLDDMFAAYNTLLLRLSGQPWEQASMIPELPRWQQDERDAANATAADFPERTLYDLVADTARRRPEATAVIAHDGPATYGDLLDEAHRLAARLIALGARRNTLTAVVVPKSRGQVAAVLGVVRSGAAYLPIDPDWPQARREQLLEQGGVGVVVTTGDLRERLAWPEGLTLVTLEDAEVLAADPDALDPQTAPRPVDLGYVIFTSGSTGQPKGVMIEHRAAANTIQDVNSRFGVGPLDRVLALSELSFDLSVYDLFGVLAAGGTVVLPDPSGSQDPAHWTDLVLRHGVTLWNSVPALMQAWTESPVPVSVSGDDSDGLGPGDSRLRLVLLSGDWIPVGLPEAIRARHAGAEIVSLGGATEASIWSIHHRIGVVDPAWTSIPYGKALANQSVHVLDDAMAPCPVWVTGEIYIGGAGVAAGYWADLERTKERFLCHPATGERLYRTGDLGRFRPGGDIEFLGRADFQVKMNGYRIELDEIAFALRRQPGVAEALVGVDTNPKTGRRHLVAHIVRAADAGQADDSAEAGQAEWAGMVADGQDRLSADEAANGDDLRTYWNMWRQEEANSVLLMTRTLARLGVLREPGDTVTAEQAAAIGRVKPQHLALVREWLRLLAAEGVLTPTGQPGEYRTDTGLDEQELDAALRRGLDAVEAVGVNRIVADYFETVAGHQTELMRGEVNLLELLLPDGSTSVTDAIYATNPLAEQMNATTARIVRSFADRLPAGRPLRILEVGAGTGATTARVLPELDGIAPDRLGYRFTDVSSYFTERAKALFADHPFMEYGVYDIDRDPLAANPASAGSADVIVAANVLHNAHDLERTLSHLRTVLAPGGILVMLENTVNSPVHMVVVGYMQDVSNYADGRAMPLVGPRQWQDAATRAGFSRFAQFPAEGAEHREQHVLVAQAPHTASVDQAGLRAALTDLLPDYMVPRHYLVIDRLPLSANGKVDRAALPSPWEDADEHDQLAPRDAAEAQLFEIWAEALGHRDFGVQDDFFALGGDSLHAVRILGRIRDDFGLTHNADEGLQILFENPTVAELAAALPIPSAE